MLFYGNHFPGLFCCFYDQVFIQWFDGMNVDHFCIDAVGCQLICCCEAFGYRKSGSDDRYIFSFTKDNAFSKFKLVIRCIIDHRNCQSSKTKIYRSLMLDSGTYCCFCLDIIGRVDNNHSRDRTHQSNIFITLVCRTIFSYRDSGVCRTNFYIQFRITDGVTNLLKCTSCCKHGKRTCKWNFTGCRKACSDSHHVTLCNSTVDMTIRESFLKDSCFCRSCKVSIQNYQILIFCTKLCKCISITLTSCYFFYFTHRDSPTFSKSAIACAYCSSFGAVPCQLA